MKSLLFPGDLEVLEAVYPITAGRIRNEIENLRKENDSLALENEELKEEIRFVDSLVGSGVVWDTYDE